MSVSRVEGVDVKRTFDSCEKIGLGWFFLTSLGILECMRNDKGEIRTTTEIC